LNNSGAIFVSCRHQTNSRERKTVSAAQMARYEAKWRETLLLQLRRKGLLSAAACMNVMQE
jgi:hypothetical protein